MARPREPIDLIKAKGKTNLSKKEYDERKSQEIDVPFTDVQPPDYLTAKQKKDFSSYADKLVQIGIFTELDVDVLAQFCIARELYIGYSKQIKKVLDKENIVHKWSIVEELASEPETQEDLIKLLEKIIRRQRGEDISVIMNLQDKAHKQCLSCAKELGMTISSRCKLVVPKTDGDEDFEL